VECRKQPECRPIPTHAAVNARASMSMVTGSTVGSVDPLFQGSSPFFQVRAPWRVGVGAAPSVFCLDVHHHAAGREPFAWFTCNVCALQDILRRRSETSHGGGIIGNGGDGDDGIGGGE
jgi:hypothetical protein